MFMAECLDAAPDLDDLPAVDHTLHGNLNGVTKLTPRFLQPLQAHRHVSPIIGIKFPLTNDAG
jgi:hypothetical protein